MDDTTTFIRHNFDNATEMHEYCIQNNYIAIHYTPEGCIDWEDYSEQAKKAKGFAGAFQALKGLGQQGGLVVAQYDPRYFYVSQVNRGTEWDGTPLERELHNLHPKMLEQMCEEWLRTDYAGDYRIKYELLKTGKTLPVIDICADTRSGHRLLVQVTFAEGNKALSKARELKEYCDESASTMPTIGLFMGPEKEQDKVTSLGLKYISIESVFEQFKASDFYGDMLDKMIGIK
jgi:hypothetical protein